MKKILLILATATLSFGGFAGNPDDNKNGNNPPDNYCAEFKDGVLHVTHNGEVLTEDVHLANGTIIHTDAVIQKLDGSVTVMKPEQCVNVEGLSNMDNMKGKHKGHAKSMHKHTKDKSK